MHLLSTIKVFRNPFKSIYHNREPERSYGVQECKILYSATGTHAFYNNHDMFNIFANDQSVEGHVEFTGVLARLDHLFAHLPATVSF